MSVLVSLFSLHFYKVCFRPGNKLSLELIDKQGVKVLLALVAMNMILRGGFPIGLSGRYTLDLFAFSLSFYFCFIMFANVLVVLSYRGKAALGESVLVSEEQGNGYGKGVHWVCPPRWVDCIDPVSLQGCITSGGVSAGTDMALDLINKLDGRQVVDNTMVLMLSLIHI